ncbi:MAG: hypothetical protein R2856_18815 [Caldilineaceae bacterium]
MKTAVPLADDVTECVILRRQRRCEDALVVDIDEEEAPIARLRSPRPVEQARTAPLL